MAIIVIMKRFIALLGATLLVIGVRLYNNGLLNCGYDGQLSVGKYDTIKTEAFLISGEHRMDICGDESVAFNVIDNLDATVLFTETVDGIKIFYAYSPRLSYPVTVKDNKINLMVAVSERGVSAGTPLLYGSY